MAAEKEFNVDIINETREKAFNLSDSDKIGGVIQKGMDVLLELTRDIELNPERLKNAVNSLKSERELVYEFDEEKDDTLRKGIYGVMEAFETAFGWYAEREERLIAEAKVKKEEAKEDGDTDGKSLCEVSDSGVGSIIKREPEDKDNDDARTAKMEVDADVATGKSKEAMRAEKKKTPAAKRVKEEKGDETGTSKGKGAKRAADEEGKKTPKRSRKSAGDKDKEAGEDEEDEEEEAAPKTPKTTEKNVKTEKTTPTKNAKENSKDDEEVKGTPAAKIPKGQKALTHFFKPKN